MKKTQSMQRQKRAEALTGYAFVTPQLVGFCIIILLPLINVFIYSFYNKNMLYGTNKFVEWDNYIKLFTNDKLFWKTLGNTFVFSALLVPTNLILSLALALYIGDGKFGSRYIRTVIFLPVVTSGVAWALVWKYLLQSGTAGPVNYVLSLFGIKGPGWLTDKNWAMISVVFNRVLKNLGTNVLIFMGAVMNMPKDVIEAARMDGANEWQLFRKIKLPLLMPTVMMCSIVTLIGSMRVFDTIRLMTDGGPEGSTMVLVYYIYHQAFKMFNTGYASALSVVLFIIVLILTIIQWSLRKKVSHYED